MLVTFQHYRVTQRLVVHRSVGNKTKILDQDQDRDRSKTGLVTRPRSRTPRLFQSQLYAFRGYLYTPLDLGEHFNERALITWPDMTGRCTFTCIPMTAKFTRNMFHQWCSITSQVKHARRPADLCSLHLVNRRQWWLYLLGANWVLIQFSRLISIAPAAAPLQPPLYVSPPVVTAI